MSELSDSVNLSGTSAALSDALLKMAAQRAAEEKAETEQLQGNTKVYTSDRKKILRNVAMYAVFAADAAVIIYAAVCLVTAFIATDYSKLCSILLLDGCLVLSIAAVVVSSAWDYWNFFSRKRWFVVMISTLATVIFAELFLRHTPAHPP